MDFREEVPSYNMARSDKLKNASIGTSGVITHDKAMSWNEVYPNAHALLDTV